MKIQVELNLEDAKGRRRSVLMTPPVPKKVEVLSPAWYRAAVEFQSMQERERLVFARGAVVMEGVICVRI